MTHAEYEKAQHHLIFINANSTIFILYITKREGNRKEDSYMSVTIGYFFYF